MELEEIKASYEKLISLDKEIVKLEKQIRDFFFANVDKKDMTGKVEIPLVGNSVTEYERLRDYIREIKLKIKQINQRLNKIDYYAKGIRSELIRNGLEEDKVDEETERIVNLLRKEFENHIANLNGRLCSINEDQKAYLRFREYQESDFSMINNAEAKIQLNQMQKELMEKKNEREIISESLKINLNEEEKEEKKSKFSLKFKFFEKK